MSMIDAMSMIETRLVEAMVGMALDMTWIGLDDTDQEEDDWFAHVTSMVNEGCLDPPAHGPTVITFDTGQRFRVSVEEIE